MVITLPSLITQLNEAREQYIDLVSKIQNQSNNNINTYITKILVLENSNNRYQPQLTYLNKGIFGKYSNYPSCDTSQFNKRDKWCIWIPREWRYYGELSKSNAVFNTAAQGDFYPCISYNEN